MRVRSLSSFALFVSLSLAAACGGLPQPRHPIADADDALALEASLHRTIRTFSVEARVEHRGHEGRIRGTVLGMVALPDHVRFDVLTQLGPAAILTSDGTTFSLLDLRESRFLEGPACPANVGRLLGFDLPPRDVARLLVGEPPLLESATERSIRPIDGGYLVRLTRDDLEEEITFGLRRGDEVALPDAQHLRVRRVILRERTGRLLLDIAYSDHRVVRDPRDPEGRGVAMPFVVRVNDAVRGAETTIRVKSIDLGSEPPEEAFTIEPPSGVAREIAECGPAT